MPLAARVVAPAALPPNPVWRSYAGGRVLRRFRGQNDTADDHFPEDWLASTVRARNGDHASGPEEGLSRIGDSATGLTLSEALAQDPGFWFGNSPASGPGINVLWKFLDSAVRLQFQAHPDAEFARTRLNSQAGKTECWYILGTRGEGCVYLGFQHPPTRAAWERMIREQRIDQMLGCFEPIPVAAGDCYVVPARTPHAIGAGVFMVELMEPTDWAVRCETLNAGVRLPPKDCFMGLDLDACLDLFDYRPYSVEAVRSVFQQAPRRVRHTEAFVEEELIGPAWHQFFRLHRFRGQGDASWVGKELMLLIIAAGSGELNWGSEPQAMRAGQTWLLPGAATEWRWRGTGGSWECLLARLPCPSRPRANPGP